MGCVGNPQTAVPALPHMGNTDGTPLTEAQRNYMRDNPQWYSKSAAMAVR